MWKRFVYLEKDKVLADSGEVVTDIDVVDPVTAIWVEVRGTNFTPYNDNAPMHKIVSAIEVIDGSDIIHSMDGKQWLGMVCADLGYMPHQRFSELSGDPASMDVAMMFGRHLNDTELAFDPKRHTNPQVRTKWNLGAVRTVGSTSYQTGTGRLTIIAEVLEGAPAPRGFLSRKQWYTWTTAVGTEYIDLPVDRALRGLMFRAYKASAHPYDCVSNLKISCDGGRVIPMDIGVEDLLYLMMHRQPMLEYREANVIANNDVLYTHLTELENVMAIDEYNQGNMTVAYQNYEYGNQTFKVYLNDIAAGVCNIGLMVRGLCPFGHIYVPFGDPQVPATWFRAPDFKTIRVEALGASASAAGELCLVQEHPY